MRKKLVAFEKLRSQRILPVSKNGKLCLPDSLPTGVNGLYWIYTSYNIEDIKTCIPSTQKKALNIPKLASLHEGLSNICKITHDDFTLIYNGVGGVGKKGKGGLRERVLQEFNGGKGTGSLAILKTSLNDLSKWRISYVIMCNSKQAPEVDACYIEHATDFERIWRLEHGWPLLCRPSNNWFKSLTVLAGTG